MAAVEASSHHQTKVLVQSGIEFDQQHQCDQHAYGVLQYGNTRHVKEHTADLGARRGPFLGLVPDGGGGKDHHDQHAGIGPE